MGKSLEPKFVHHHSLFNHLGKIQLRVGIFFFFGDSANWIYCNSKYTATLTVLKWTIRQFSICRPLMYKIRCIMDFPSVSNKLLHATWPSASSLGTLIYRIVIHVSFSLIFKSQIRSANGSFCNGNFPVETLSPYD